MKEREFYLLMCKKERYGVRELDRQISAALFSDFGLDLLFYHRDLLCLIAIEIKIDKFKPEYLGKLNFYLEALD